ncbi:hypothetical protein DDE82_001135 [Stemphylium lycopersici]|uniref:Uncharacterized protein n=1 Tax=Stemphylium lycopersici TaxID=183478 RepID=A0A364NB79_STELY|nr:hypothetical protein DDE82_001135 [Stemphylium lycopersici]RAR14578.1 hypothetical protein DDE83_001977 [Stemphylium lycopersici]
MTSALTSPPSNSQQQSPLFGVLPAEIRNEIFELALMQYEDNASAYPKDSYWYRPGFSGPHKGSSALLRTCKIAYAEGQKVFLRELEWAFWFDRGPKGRTCNSACEDFFRNLTPQAAQSLQKVRFFTQMYWLEDGQNTFYLFSLPQFRPTQLTITIRYSDWWNWEHNAPLSMKEGWLRFFKGNPGLRELRVEYETLSWKKDEMMRIIQRNKGWKLPVRREGGDLNAHELEGYLSAEGTQLEEWKWRGPSKLDGETWVHHGTADTIEYVVVTDTWKFVEGKLGEKELEGRLTAMRAAPVKRRATPRHTRLHNRLRRRMENPVE